MSDSLPVAEELRVEEICTAFEDAWRVVGPPGDAPRLGDYLGDATGPMRRALLVEPLRLDLYYRRRRGESPGADDYAGRCPGDAEAIHALFPAVAGPGRPPAAHRREAGVLAASQPFGHYRVVREIGRGGMGVVYQAQDERLGRVVALKVLLAGSHAGPQLLERFHCEARAAAQLRHPNIVQVYDLGEQDGLPYIAMEHCPRGSLKESLGGKPRSPREATELVVTLARAVQAAHDKGVVHRDIKPANVLLAEDSTLKVTDFGLAKLVDEAGAVGPGEPTRTGVVMGTPAYMAPEQADGRSRQTGATADVYALGVVLYELLTGRPPFQGPTDRETIDQVLTHDPVPPSRLQPQVPPELERICLTCLEKDPRDRYPSAGHLAEDLVRHRDGLRPRCIPSRGLLARLWATISWPGDVYEFLGTSDLQLVVAAFFAAGHLGVFLALRLGGPWTEPLVWLALVGWDIPILTRFPQVRQRLPFLVHVWGPPGPVRPADRRMCALMVGHLAAFACVAAGYRLAPGADYRGAVLTAYPAFAALSGLLACVLGSTYWSRYYVLAALCMALALVMPLAPTWGARWKPGRWAAPGSSTTACICAGSSAGRPTARRRAPTGGPHRGTSK
jgi:serine/threonine protein kinase